MLVCGLQIVVETPAGQVRQWRQHDGRSGETQMTHDYGYIADTVGADGEEVDVFVGPDPDSREACVVRQMRPPDFSHYDEDKVMLGFSSVDEARRVYLDHYDDPRFLGSIETMPVGELKTRLQLPGALRADAAERAALWLAAKYGVDMSRVTPAQAVARAAAILGVAPSAQAVANRLDGEI